MTDQSIEGAGNIELNHITGMAPLIRAMAVARMSSVPLIIDGPPGIGKTQILEGVAKWGAKVLPPDVQADEFDEDWVPNVTGWYTSQHDNIEFMMPFVDPETREYSMVPAPMLTRVQKGDYLVVDEWFMEGCNEVGLQLFSGDRGRVGNYILPRGVTRIGIGNNAESGNFSQVENPVLGNRTAQVSWTPLFNEWLINYAIPHGVHPVIIAAVQMEGQNFFLDYKSDRMINTTARSLTNASDALHALKQYNNGIEPTSGERSAIIGSFLPRGATLKIQSLFHLMDKLVPYGNIVADPTGVTVPENPAALFMTLANVARKTIPDDWSAVMEFVNRLPLELRPAVVEGVVAKHKHPVLKATPEFQRYAIDTAEMIL